MGIKDLKTILKTALVFLILALVLRHGVFTFYVVEGSSMSPTLHQGERVAVNKLVYRLRAPQCGDVIVFRNPAGDNRVFVKRIIALAGDRVAINQGVVLVNGVPLEEDYIKASAWDHLDEVVVGPASVFVLGDNRSPGGSLDSRGFGPIAISSIVGRTDFVLFPRPHRLD
jgi:signal peptidase I